MATNEILQIVFYFLGLAAAALGDYVASYKCLDKTSHIVLKW
jgi:hypothetical protein